MLEDEERRARDGGEGDDGLSVSVDGSLPLAGFLCLLVPFS